MKKTKQRVSLLLCFIVLAGAFSGCTPKGSDKSSPESTAGTSASTESSTEDLDVIDVVLTTPYMVNETMEVYGNNDNDPIIKYLGDKFKMNIKVWSGGPGEYHSKLQLQYSAGQGPDAAGILIWDGGEALYKDMFAQGALLDTGAMIKADPERYNVLSKIIEEDFYKVQNKKWNGDKDTVCGLFEIAASLGLAGSAGFYMPYLEKAGVTELPKTTDEFIEVLRKIKKSDVNGNGKVGDVIPYAPNTYKGTALTEGFQEMFFNPEGTMQSGIGLDYETGTKYVGYDIDPKHIPIFKKIADAYKEGLIDKEFLTREQYANWDLLAQGKTACITANLPNSVRSLQYSTTYKKMVDGGNFPDLKVEDFKLLEDALVGSNGNTVRKYGVSTATAVVTMIPKNTKHPDRILDLYNFLWSDEGQNIIWYGVPDVTFKMNAEGKPELIGDAFQKICNNYSPKDLNRVSWDPFLILTDVSRGYCQYERDGWVNGAVNAEALELTRRGTSPEIEYSMKVSEKWMNDYFKPLPAYFAAVSITGPIRDKELACTDITMRYNAGFMTGEIDVEKEFDKYVAELKAAGYDEVLAEYNRQLEDAKATLS